MSRSNAFTSTASGGSCASYPQTRVAPSTETVEHVPRPGSIEDIPVAERRRQQARLLHHPSLLGVEQPILVDVEIQDARHRQEDHQQVERQQAQADPRGARHESRST